MAGFTVTVPLSGNGGFTGSGVPEGTLNTFDNSGCQSHNEVCIWLMPDGRPDIVIDVGGMTFSGDCDGIDALPLSRILDIVSPAVIEQGILLGHLPCAGSTTATDSIDVLTTACANRLGSETATTFTPCDGAWCRRRYQVVCSPGAHIITELAGIPSECSGGSGVPCEEGCPEGSGINLSFGEERTDQGTEELTGGTSMHEMQTIRVDGPVRRFR